MIKLNEQQENVIDWVLEGEGSLNLIARAGCGKTFTLIRGIIRTIVRYELGSVALMAFNKSAAREFGAKLEELGFAEDDDRRFTNLKYVAPGTVHSFGFAAVRRWAGRGIEVDKDKCSKIVDSLSSGDDVYGKEKATILKLVSLGKQSVFSNKTPKGDWRELAEHHGLDDTETPLTEVIDAVRMILKRSVRQDREVVDFDDMIYVPLIRDLKMYKKDWVLIDEAQDTNTARRLLALKMLKPRGRLVAVGDDRQAIYGFTGADQDALDLIAQETGAHRLPLTVTYRCPKAVVKEANRLVPDLVAHKSAPEGSVRYCSASTPGATVPTPNPGKGESDGEADERAKDGENAPCPWFKVEKPTWKDAVLCRNVRPLIECAYSMIANGVGCRVEGREIGEGLIKLAQRWKRVETLGQLHDALENYRAREERKWKSKGKPERIQPIVDQVETLQTMITSLSREGKENISDLVSAIRVLFGDTLPGERPRVVTLSTIHKAKGREWNRVYFLARALTIPSPYAEKEWQQGQEANLEYVAVTRAMKELVYVD